jgi:hypothetical protein
MRNARTGRGSRGLPDTLLLRQTVRQHGSHVRMKHPDRWGFLVVPLHRELKRGTLSGILRDAGLDRDHLRKLL